MLQWCIICQKYNGQKPPYGDFSVSHGLCESCAKNNFHKTMNPSDETMEMAQFFKEIWTNALKGHPIEPRAIIQKAQKLKISNSSLLIGIIQPILIEIGNYFEKGKINVRIEHQFSKIVNKIIYLMDLEESPQGKLDVLLFNADGNYHTIGPYFLKARLKEEGINTEVIVPGLPLDEAVDYTKEKKPIISGVSISLDDQLNYLEKYSEQVKDITTVYAGGLGLIGKEASCKSYYTIMDVEKFIKDVLDMKKQKAS